MRITFDLVDPIGPNDHVLGDSSAPVEVVEYGDFQCPACRVAIAGVNCLLERFEGQVKFAYRHFPLEEIHPYALCAAEAAECAGAQGRFWEMHQLLFENQRHLDRRSLHEYAQSLGLDMARYRSEMDGESYRQRIREQMEVARRSNLRATPGFFVDRRIQDTSFGMRSLFDATEAALRRRESGRYQRPIDFPASL
jgi:protein-disulfide isomerase